jgi:enamine deaminase RidA (YjgF/YER057c/UK114 family)
MRQHAGVRQNLSSNTPWERLAGYSRAVRVGSTIWVAGTTASDATGQVQGDDAAGQTRYILNKIEATLRQAGAELTHVVRTRIYVANLEDWEAVARIHGEVFGSIRPANSLIQVAGLVDGRLVEIEADAVVED